PGRRRRSPRLLLDVRMTTASENARSGIALVTGGGQGIGAAICRRLAADGHRVLVNDLDGTRAEDTCRQIRSAGGAAEVAVADVSDSAAVNAMFDAAEAEFGMVTILVNNAGIGGNAAIRNVTDEYWERILAVDLNSTLY